MTPFAPIRAYIRTNATMTPFPVPGGGTPTVNPRIVDVDRVAVLVEQTPVTTPGGDATTPVTEVIEPTAVMQPVPFTQRHPLLSIGLAIGLGLAGGLAAGALARR